MARRVAVEDALTDVQEALQAKGFEVTKLTDSTIGQCDCAVVTGLSNNFMGIEETDGNRCSVIEASGKTAEEIVALVQSRTAQH